MRLINYLLLGLFAFPALLYVTGFIGPHLAKDADVTSKLTPTAAEASSELYVLIHGMSPKQERWEELAKTLQPRGWVLSIHYNAALWSNAKPDEIAAGIGDEVRMALATTGAEHVTFVSHSMGALLTRKAILTGCDTGAEWVKRIKRTVFLAGVNRGWDLAGDPPADVEPLHRFSQRLGYWGASMLNIGGLIFSFERGAPFVADLRVHWMQWIRDPSTLPIEVVQLLGDIDDVVSREDNEDLRVIASNHFVQLIVRGTGHGDIVNFGLGAAKGTEERQLGDYRKEKTFFAATADFAKLQAINDVQPFTTNDRVTELVFVLHGIRDLGRWSAKFEQSIAARYPEERARMAMVSPRYGYFGMGPFLFEGVRKRYVRWFMDEYTEALARYPNVDPRKVRFFGHSNGTYLLADALLNYKAMKIDRIVFAGSVVPKSYEWSKLTEPLSERQQGRVSAIRNYVGTEDWVVALFPRLFELPVASWLGNAIGSAGFNGFDDKVVDNVRFVHGQHSAYDDRVDEIVDYLMGSNAPVPQEKRSLSGDILSMWPTVIIVWLLLIFVVVGLGTRVVAASAQPAWPALLLYIGLVVMILRTV